MHHHNLERLAALAGSKTGISRSNSSSSAIAQELLSTERLPSNTAMQGISKALAAAVRAAAGDAAVMVMVVQPGERNAYDQQVCIRWLLLQYGVYWLTRMLCRLPGRQQLFHRPRRCSHKPFYHNDPCQYCTCSDVL